MCIGHGTGYGQERQLLKKTHENLITVEGLSKLAKELDTQERVF